MQVQIRRAVFEQGEGQTRLRFFCVQKHSAQTESITTDDRDSEGASGDYEGGSHGIMENAARRTVGEQARSADKRTWGEVELPGADSSAAGSPSPEVNEYWRQLTNIDTKEIKKDQAVGRRSEFLEEQKLDESLTHYWQVAEARSKEYIIVGDMLYRTLDANLPSLHDKALMVPVKYRQQILHIAHDNMFSAHSGVKSTTDRIASNFF